MITTVKFNVLTYNGSKKSIKVKFDVPDFVEETSTFNVILNDKPMLLVTTGDEQREHIKHKYTTSIIEQLDAWVQNEDLSELMSKMEIHTIFNWTIVNYTGMSKRHEHESSIKLTQSSNNTTNILQKLSVIDNMKMFFKFNNIDQNVVDNYIMIYSRMSETLHGISWQKQMEIVFKTMNIAMKATSEGLDNITRYSQALGKVDWSKHKYTDAKDIDKYGMFNMESIRREAKMIQDGHEMNPDRLIKT